MAYADQQGRSAPSAETYKMLELFGDVLTAVDQQYVVPVDNKKLVQAAIDGMLTSLDPHSGYPIPPPSTRCATRPAAITAGSACR